MIIVLEKNGKGENNADTITVLLFEELTVLAKHILTNTQRYEDGHKYWTIFEIVTVGEPVSTDWQ